jgi:hypothetical protein
MLVARMEGEEHARFQGAQPREGHHLKDVGVDG